MQEQKKKRKKTSDALFKKKRYMFRSQGDTYVYIHFYF